MKIKTCIFSLVTCIGLFSRASALDFPDTIGDNGDSLPNRILIINAFDAMNLHVRNNKKELFRELTDSLKQYLSNEIRDRYQAEAGIFANLLTGISANDSGIVSLMTQNTASISIVIRDLNVFFDQTGVEVTGEKGSKDRTASYDICSVVAYDLYKDDGKVKSFPTTFCEFFTKRSVLSGFFASGPDVVGKKKHTFPIVNKNASRFLDEPEVELVFHQ